MNRRNVGSVFSADIIEFVTLSTTYCAFVEHPEDEKTSDLCTSLLKMLYDIYQKCIYLSDFDVEDSDDMDDIEEYITEEQYNYVRSQISALLGSEDDYLDTFVEEMKYSDKPILKTISEDLADVYQALGNFVYSYQTEIESVMFIALNKVLVSFSEYWGGRLLSAVRALHEVAFNFHNEEE